MADSSNSVPVPSITCPHCGLTSHNPHDIGEGYCGHCHDFTSGEHSLLAFTHWLQTGEIPEWRQKFLEARAFDDALHETLQHLRETL